MKTPEWYSSYARLIPAMTAEQKLVYLEMADCIDSMKLHIDAFESVAPTPGAVEDVMRENLLQNTKIQLLESTYSQLSKSLCSKENATPEEILQASDQLKTRLCQAEREKDALDAIQKQTPKAVEHSETLYRDGTCPSCGNVVSEHEKWGEKNIRIEYEYCHFCGQHLDWNGFSEEPPCISTVNTNKEENNEQIHHL